MDPDPGGPKTCGSGFGSGSRTLLSNLIPFCLIILHLFYQLLRVELLSRQLESLRSMLMKKDSEIRQLKAEMPLTPSGKPVDRYGTRRCSTIFRIHGVLIKIRICGFVALVSGSLGGRAKKACPLCTSSTSLTLLSRTGFQCSGWTQWTGFLWPPPEYICSS